MIKPFAHSVTVSDIPAEDERRDNGLIVVGNQPMVDVERGIVVAIADDDCPHTAKLKPGDLLYYKRGGFAQIGDVKVVPEDYIIGYDDEVA